MQTILRVVTPRDQVGASVVLLILDLLLLILELFDACLACLCTLSALFLSASSCIGVTCVAVLSLDTSRVAGATPIEHTLPNSRKLLLRILALAWSWSWSTLHLVVVIDWTLELLFPELAELLVVMSNLITQLAVL